MSDRPQPIVEEVRAQVGRFAEREDLFRNTRSLLVAVSGGPDSLALLELTLALRERFGFDLQAAHFDHMLRPGSRADLEFVHAHCAERGVPCFTGEGDVAAAARERRGSVEETARRMRYQFLAFVAGQKQADAIATGHTQDDQVETVLMRVVRGSGVRGIRGILPASPVPGSPAHRLLRPLLCLRRAETVAVCEGAGLTPRLDPSNRETTLLRNRLRHETLPALRTINPSVDQALLGLAASAREAFAEIERRSFSAVATNRGPAGAVFERGKLVSLPSEALILVIEREAAFFKLEPEMNRTRVENVEAVLAAQAGIVHFGGVEVEVSAGKVRVGPPVEPTPFEPVVLNVPGITAAGSMRVDVATEPFAGAESAAAIDSSALSGALRIRAIRPGDRIVFRARQRNVSDVLSNEKVPAWDRRLAVAVADGVRVHAVLAPGATFDAAPDPEVALYVRLSPLTSARPG